MEAGHAVEARVATGGIYDEGLERNAANHQPLTPLTYL